MVSRKQAYEDLAREFGKHSEEAAEVRNLIEHNKFYEWSTEALQETYWSGINDKSLVSEAIRVVLAERLSVVEGVVGGWGDVDGEHINRLLVDRFWGDRVRITVERLDASL